MTALPITPGAEDPETVLAALGRAYMKVLMAPANLALYRMVIAEAARSPALGQKVYLAGPAAAAESLADYLAREVKRGRLAIKDVQLAARHFLELIKGDLHTRALFGGRRAGRREIDASIQGGVRIFLHGSTRTA